MYVRLLASLILLFTASERVVAQQPYVDPTGLDPTSWFPLEVGNYWYRTDDGGEGVTHHSTWIEQSVRDTIVDGTRWTRIEVVALVRCAWGPPHCPTGGRWFAFTNDYYLLRSSGFEAAPDTVLPTQPRSIFDLRAPRDTLRYEGDTSAYPLVVKLLENETGNAADSTHLSLHACANVFFCGRFVYKIGGSLGIGHGLLGAMVNGVAYGETDEIQQVLLSSKPDRSHERMLSVYPNPLTANSIVEFVPGR